MSTVQGGVITRLSASQAETFDSAQVGGCPRRWYFEHVEGLERPQSDAARDDGDAGHAHFAHYYRTGQRPRRARMGKAVNGALDAGHLPARDAGQLIESRFDGQPARGADGERLPLRPSSTLWLGGVPWDGYVDLRFYRAGMITVLDHKFSSDIHAYAKPADELLSTVQMPVYALDSLRIWPNAQHIELVHHYVSRRGVDSFKRRQLVTTAQVHQRGVEIEALVVRMRAVTRAVSQDAVPFNLKSCDTWSGCPFQSRCTAFRGRFKMSLADEDLSWLVEAVEGPAATEAQARVDLGKPPQVTPEQETDDVPATLVENVTQALVTSAAHAETLAAEDPFAVFAPAASVPAAGAFVPPACTACGQELNGENGSRKDGTWKHIGCPADAPRAPRAAAGGPRCADCPHPPHVGVPCAGKRGRGACRCGAVAQSAPTSPPQPPAFGDFVLDHLPTCVLNNAGKWLCWEGCTASGRPQGGTHSEHPAGQEAELRRQRAAAESIAQGDVGAPEVRRIDDADTSYQRLQDAPVTPMEHTAEATQTLADIDIEARVVAAGTPPGGFVGTATKPPIGMKVPRSERFSGAEPNPPGVFNSAGDTALASSDPRVTEALNHEREMHRRTLGELETSERELKRLREAQQPPGAPTPMLLWCPACHARHIDVGEFAEKPHHTHACQSCGLAWRPAVVATVGVQFLPGFKS